MAEAIIMVYLFYYLFCMFMETML